MKPNVFIGSSVEGLNVAYALQENLEYTANVTVWDQGIFTLSSDALTDLITALDDFDFGIFVFSPDDAAIIREKKSSIVRDNVLFELGLFMGRLGRNQVFCVVPKSAADLHLPTDLNGMTKGVYDDGRDDGRLKAALGPFSNKVRDRISTFGLIDKNRFTNESLQVKNIIRNRAKFWEYYLAAQIVEDRLPPLQHRYSDLKRGVFYLPTQVYDRSGYLTVFQSFAYDMENIINSLSTILKDQFEFAIGPAGEPGNAEEIRRFADNLISLGVQIFDWDARVKQSIPPPEFDQIPVLFTGAVHGLLETIFHFPSHMRFSVEASVHKSAVDQTKPYRFDFGAVTNAMSKSLAIVRSYL